eukprot:TRINITY_DN13039_c0_g1_i1.p1 TRINITY_DN13039_c0_g1~~TRINITY_DN13039_c0_g1_i1.p1  ORF type:complete len:470 (+),score=163.91 TRINITY_DN13039_c0_g1_i1:158-1567(+)
MSRAAELEALYAAPESFDPADLDGLGDDTTASTKKRKRKQASVDEPVDLGPSKGRLRMRAEVPLPEKFKGKRTDRKTVFGEDKDEDEDIDSEFSGADVDGDASDDLSDLAAGEDDEDGEGSDEDNAGITGAAGGGLSISKDLEAEYEKMMGRTQHELEVMRAPSSAEVEKRKAEAVRLKTQLDTWSALVELRIHLEGALSLGHQLPVGANRGAFCEADAGVAAEASKVEGEVRGLLGSLVALQQGLGERAGVADLPSASAASSGSGEAAAWNAVDSRVKPVLDWALGVADDWKERTRLDARRSFKVLDQSVSSQMQAFVETDAEKLRRRSLPPPGRHHVFGATRAADGEPGAKDANDDSGAATEAPAGGEEFDIYDDRDFYVQLLREVLAGGGSAGDETRELQAELQGRRAKKQKQRTDVERRASKGRKIRYVPIERLQNFMAPRPRGDIGDAMEALLQSLYAKAKGAY